MVPKHLAHVFAFFSAVSSGEFPKTFAHIAGKTNRDARLDTLAHVSASVGQDPTNSQGFFCDVASSFFWTSGSRCQTSDGTMHLNPASPTKDRDAKVDTRCSKILRERLERIAQAKDVNISDVIREALRQYVLRFDQQLSAI
jgi:hypothetical protein